MRARAILCHILALAMILSPAGVSAESEGTCQSDNPLFGYRGINVTMGRGIAASDIDYISEAGANLIRLVINADPHSDYYDGVYAKKWLVSSDFLQELDRIIESAGNRNLRVLIDMHTFPGHSGGRIWRDYKYWRVLESTWAAIASRYAGNKVVIGYDLINEPNLMASAGPFRSKHVRSILEEDWSFPDRWRDTPRDYFKLASRIAERVSSIDEGKVIVVAGVGLGGRATNFRWMEPIPGKNIVYTFHTYVPRSFGDLGKSSPPLGTYNPDKDYALLVQDASHPAEFAKRYGAHIFVGEFGLTYHAEGRGAARWMSDWIGIFEKNCWPWAYWTYSIDLRKPNLLPEAGKLTVSEQAERMIELRRGWSINSSSLPTPSQ